MPITLDAAVTAALDDPHFGYAMCVSLPGGYNVTNNPNDLTVDSVTYTSDEILVAASDTTRKYAITADGAEIRMGNADQTMYQDYVTNGYVNEPITLTLVFVDEDFNLLNANATMPVYKGVLDSWTVQESKGQASIAFKMTSHWSAWKVTKGRKTNTGSQAQYYPNDTVFEYSHQEELPVKWGY
jgi:hypothetical protein